MKRSVTQAVSGEITTADRALVQTVGQSSPPARGAVSVIEAATRDKTPAAPASGHRRPAIIFGYRCCQCGRQHSTVLGSKFRVINGYKRRVCPDCLAAEALATAA